MAFTTVCTTLHTESSRLGNPNIFKIRCRNCLTSAVISEATMGKDKTFRGTSNPLVV
uniref:Uncharacterized protein MANES_09G046200 n=1 Tax=Rhizophora mucronata TaxID=61149 RepID=A0A2P2LKX1_RHIMU